MQRNDSTYSTALGNFQITINIIWKLYIYTIKDQ